MIFTIDNKACDTSESAMSLENDTIEAETQNLNLLSITALVYLSLFMSSFTVVVYNKSLLSF